MIFYRPNQGVWTRAEVFTYQSLRWLVVSAKFFIFFFDLQFQFEVGLLIAVTLSSLVCLSRLYTGMHSVLVSESLTNYTT